MKDKESIDVTDDLLRSVLADDLPPDTERVMTERIVRFRQEVRQVDRGSAVWYRPRWAIVREALALASVIMISVGGFLHTGGHQSAMANTFSFLNSSVTVSEQVLGATSMECRARVRGEDGRTLDYVIRWAASKQSNVVVHEGDTLVKTYSSTGEINVADPQLEPVLSFLTPVALSDAIYKKWRPERFGKRIGEKTTTLIYVNGRGETLLAMEVDLTTYLPRRIEKDAVEANFTWNEAGSPGLVLPNEEGS